MEYLPKTLPLKSGAHCLIRQPTAADGEAVLTFQQITSGETPYLVVGPEDITQTVEEQAQRLENWNRSPRRLRLMAEVDGRLAGIALLYGVGDQRRLCHRCSVDITLYREFWGMGLGTALLREILTMAQRAGYQQAELEVVTTNTAAIALYEKLGFRSVGTIPHALRYADGAFADFLLMVKPLS